MKISPWDFSCPDWSERLRLRKSLLPALPLLNSKEADRAVKIFNRLRLPDVPDQPTLEEAAGEWQRDIVRPIFGSLDQGYERHVPEVFAMVPKKSSKTTGGAAIMITALLMNLRPRAEFGLVGPTHEIAELAFNQAAGMINADPDNFLQTRFHVRDHLKTIVDRKTEATLKVKTFDLLVATGGKWAGLLLDELHIMSSMSFASRLIGQLRGGMISNSEAFMITITTQSDSPPSGVFLSELNYARGVRDGKIKDSRVLPLIYEFPEEVQRSEEKIWQDPSIWYYVLPNLDKSITLKRLKSDYKAALEKGEEEERRWASQHLNIEIGMGLHDRRWRGADYWLGAQEKSLGDLDILLEQSDVVTIGVDGGGLDDLLGLGVIGRHKETKVWMAWAHAWAQTDVLEKRKDIAEKLEDFARDGDLTICTKDQVQRDVIELCDIIEKIFLLGLLPEKDGVGLDPYSISAIIDDLASRHIYTGQQNGPVTGIKQGSALSPASWGMERKLKDKTLVHSGSALMIYCVGNARAEQRGNATLITKQTAGKAKIDPLIALFNAFMLMSKNPKAKPRVNLDDWLNTPAMMVT